MNSESVRVLGGAGDVAVTMISDDQRLNVPLNIINNHDGTYRVEFEASTPAIYNTSVTFAGQLTPASPYKVNVLPTVPTVDTSKVRVTDLPDSE